MILCIIRVWTLFSSVRVYVSLHFLQILLEKRCFCIFVFQILVLLYVLNWITSYKI